MTTPLPTTAHNQAILGDTLTSVALNYEWRRFVVAAVASELKRQFAVNDDGTIPDDLENWLNDLILDFYDFEVSDVTGTFGGAKIYRSTNQNNSSATNVWWNVSFDTEIEDTDSYVNIGAQPTRITIPATGTYLIGAFAVWESNTTADTARRAMRIYLNNTTVLGYDQSLIVSQQIPLNIVTKHSLTAGDYIEMQMLTSIPNLNIAALATYAPLFWIERLR